MIDRSLAWAYGNDLISDRVKEPKTMVHTAPTMRTVSTDDYTHSVGIQLLLC
jgi:hypothetical protein